MNVTTLKTKAENQLREQFDDAATTLPGTGWVKTLRANAFAAFAGNVVEGVVIDTDHWRHVYVLLALLWGMMFAPARSGGRA